MWIAISDLSAAPGVVLGAKVTLLLAVVWIIHWRQRMENPRWHVWLWRMALTGVVAIPVLAWAGPGWTIRVPAAAPSADSESPAEQRPSAARTDAPFPVVRSHPPERNLPSSADVVTSTDLETAVRATETLPVSPSEPPIHWRVIVTGIWLIVSAVLLLRLLRSAIGTRRLIREAAPADPSVMAVVRQAQAESGLHWIPDVRVSSLVDVPFAAGLFRPVVVLPTSIVQTTDDVEQRMILTHELAHIAGRDIPWNTFAWILHSLMWFHPLVWRLPAAHQYACETVCDAFATRSDASRAAYRSMLARLALQANGRSAAGHGVILSATADITRRLRRLSRPVPCHRLLIRHRLSAACAACTVVIAIAAATLVPESRASLDSAGSGAIGQQAAAQQARTERQESDTEDASDSNWQIRLQAIDADTGAPMTDAVFTVQLGEESTTFNSNEAGEYLATVPSRVPRYCYLKVRADGYTPMLAFWGNRSDGIRDELPAELTFRMTRGVTVGGFVVDEEQQPIEDAVVLFSAIARHPGDRIEQSFYHEELRTDEHGHWRCRIAPREMNDASFSINHPDFALVTPTFSARRFISDLKAETHRWVLKKGFVVRGVVTDSEGRPVEGAHLAAGTLNSYHQDGPFAVTDRNGRYEFRRITASSAQTRRANPYQMSVTVLAKGLAPQVAVIPGTGERELESSTANERIVNFRLAKGRPLTIRLTDSDGHPVDKVWVFPSEWHHGTDGLSVLQEHGIPKYSDGNGIWHWENAPTDGPLQYDILGRGFMDIRHRVLDAGNDYDIILHEPQILTGHVIDAETRQPIDEFVIQKGFERKGRGLPDDIWWTSETQGRSGEYRRVVSLPARNGYRWRFIARGYEHFVSPSIAVNEGQIRLDVELKKKRETELVRSQPFQEDARERANRTSLQNQPADPGETASVIQMIRQLGGTVSTRVNEQDVRIPGRPIVRVSLANARGVDDGVLNSLECFDQLAHLDLRETAVSDAGIKSVGRMQQLTWLSLAQTQVTDDCLRDIGQLKNLQELNLSRTGISDAGLSRLRNLPNLSVLNLSGTSVTSDGVPHLNRLPALTYLNISCKGMSDEGLRQLSGLSQLRRLAMQSSQITDEGLLHLTALKNLEDLYLFDTQVTDEGLRTLVRLKGLKRLSLARTPVTNAGLATLTALEDLETLLLSETRVTDSGLKLLASFRHLNTLNLNATPISDAGLKTLSELLQLDILYLHKVPGISADGVSQLRQSRPNLTVIQ